MTRRVPTELRFQGPDPDEVETAMVFTTHHGSCVDVDAFFCPRAGDGGDDDDDDSSGGQPAYRLVLRLRITKPEVAAKFTTSVGENELVLVRVPPEHENYMTYAEVYYWNCDRLPDELTETEKSLFVKTKKRVKLLVTNDDDNEGEGGEEEVWFYSNERELRERYGFRVDLDLKVQTRIKNRVRGEILKLSRGGGGLSSAPATTPTSPTVIDTKTAASMLVSLYNRNSSSISDISSSLLSLFYVGSGVSAAAGLMFGKQGEEAIRQRRGVAVDDYVRTILASGEIFNKSIQ